VTIVSFPPTWPDTARALHGYAAVLGAVPRAHADPHPRWWHVGLVLGEGRLETERVALPDGGYLRLGLAPAEHLAWIEGAHGSRVELPLDAGMSADDFADRVFSEAAAAGLGDSYDRSSFASDDTPAYDRAASETYWANLMAVHSVLQRRRDEMDDPGEIHVWPHHFDMSFEWYGTRTVAGEDGSSHPAQINLGFNVLGDQYVYSSPWPFDEALLEERLTPPGSWHTEGWTGAMLPFAALLDDESWDERILTFAREVYAAGLPLLTA
jgi:hypothetical protein